MKTLSVVHYSTSDNQERREPAEQEENIVPAVDTVRRARTASCPSKDVVDVASDDSFRAGHEPSWIVVMGTGTPHQPGTR